LLEVSGTAADVERALHVNLELARRPDQSSFFRPDRDLSIDLDVPIQAITGLDNFERPRHFGGSSPTATYISRDLRTAYASGSNLKGTGQTIGILALDGYDPNDVANYRADAGLPPLAPTKVLYGGANGSPSGSSAETVADIELAMAMAPAANVKVYIGGGTDWTAWCADYLSMLNDIAHSSPLSYQNSTSFGLCLNSNTLSVIEQMASQGQSLFVPSGDAGGYPNNYQPYGSAEVTVVGGTKLTMNGAGMSYQSEVTWDNPALMWSSGGGVEYEIAIPSWQANTTFSSGSGASATNRNDPDVSMVARDLYIRSSHPNANYFEGTSAAAPLWAGFMALVNERWALAGMSGPVGWASPAIWDIGRNPAAYAIAFNDITSGTATSYWPGGTTYSAVTGYDLTTGWGTPKPPLIDQIACVQLTTSGPVPGTPPDCLNSIGTSLGDTHLTTFNGLFYDFQASGDFVLAQEFLPAPRSGSTTALKSRLLTS
jgi:subtilase family serine protease